MTPNKPGIGFAFFVLLFIVWLILRLNLWFFFGVIAVGWLVDLYQRRWQLLAMWRVARAPDDPMPEFMRPPRSWKRGPGWERTDCGHKQGGGYEKQ